MTSRAALAAYLESDEFARRCAETFERQKAGDVLMPRDLAEALGVPFWFVRQQLMATARRDASRLMVPDSARPQ